MKKKVLLLILATFLAKIVAFFKDMLLAYYYGTSNISDIYIMALTIPVVIFGFFSSGITAGFIPTYKKTIDRIKNIEDSNIFTNSILILLILISIIFIVLYFLFNKHVIEFIAYGFETSDKILTVSFSNIVVFSLVFSCITTMMSSYLQANDKTAVIGLLSIPLNIVVLLSVIMSAIFTNFYVLPYGYLLASIVQSVVFVLIAYKNGFRFNKSIELWNDDIKFFLSSILLLTIASSVNQINILIDKMLASGISIGGVSSLEYGKRIFDLISGVFILTISTVQFPRFVFSKSKIDISNNFYQGIKLLLVFLIPISLVIFFFSKEVVILVYARGAFKSDAIIQTSTVVFFYSFGLITIGIRELTTKLYYAFGSIKQLVLNSIIGVLINIVLNFIFVKPFGIGGLAFATSISSIIIAISLLLQIKEKIDFNYNYIYVLKLVLISIISTILCKVIIIFISIKQYNFNIIFGFIIFAIVYLIGLFVFKIVDYKSIKNALNKIRN